MGELLHKVIPILTENLKPEKDVELRLKVFLFLSRLLVKSTDTVDSQGLFYDYFTIVVRDMLIPNLIWHAGRTSAAIRTVSVTCLWALLQSNSASKDKVK